MTSFDEFVSLLNAVMLTAPEYSSQYSVSDQNMDDPNPSPGEASFQDDPAGVVAFPVNALLAWPMSTGVGQDLFANVLVNDCFLRILNYWQETFLTAEGSRYVLPATTEPATPRPDKAVGWLSDDAKKQMVLVAFAFAGTKTDVTIEDQTFVCTEGGTGLRPTFEEVFDLPNPKDTVYAGFSSWDNFFLRKFSLMGNNVGHGPRPLNGLRGYQPWPQSSAEDDSVIVNACESAPLKLDRDVSAKSRFWLKEQEYSLSDMLNKDELAHNFYGGCVYQGYLSALSYHRWNAPVSGTVVKVDFIPGAYFLESMHTGFDDFENDSQMFLTATATRMAIYIQAKDPNIGLMCFLAIGMGEVSSCEATVKAGQVLQKGDEIGKFHYGGSSHCLIFTKEAAEKLDFFTELKTPSGEDWYNTKPGLSASNVPVLAQIAKYNPNRVSE